MGPIPSWFARVLYYICRNVTINFGVQVLRVRSCVAGSHAAQVLKDGDLVLAVNSQPVTSYGHVESIVAACSLAAQLSPHQPGQPPVPDTDSNAASTMLAELQCGKCNNSQPAEGKMEQLYGAGDLSSTSQQQGHSPMLIKAARPASSELGCSAPLVESQQNAAAMPRVSVTICRGSAVEEVEVQLGSEDGLGTCRLIHWCGAMFQAPHRPVRELGFAPEQAGVYVSRWHHGSPAHRYSLYALHWLTELNGQPVPDLDTFVAMIRSLPDKSFARLKLCQLETTKTKVLSIKLDLRYWPTCELRLDPVSATWTRSVLSSQATHSCL
ncbi:hypothetical protein ABBQ38_009527 [Trebouxia sp. C0009 RCD-2024]